jgi:hypothetical protein
MSLDSIRLRIQTPIECVPPGRGFYQKDEDSLYVQVGPFADHHRYFSFLESSDVRLDIDKEGRLVFAEVSLPRRQWKTDHNLVPPATTVPSDIRWLDFRQSIPSPILVSDPSRKILQIRFSDRPAIHSALVADSIIVQSTSEQTLAAIWITEIIDDTAGIKLSAFRRAVRRAQEHPESKSPYLRLPA